MLHFFSLVHLKSWPANGRMGLFTYSKIISNVLQHQQTPYNTVLTFGIILEYVKTFHKICKQTHDPSWPGAQRAKQKNDVPLGTDKWRVEKEIQLHVESGQKCSFTPSAKKCVAYLKYCEHRLCNSLHGTNICHGPNVELSLKVSSLWLAVWSLH